MNQRLLLGAALLRQLQPPARSNPLHHPAPPTRAARCGHRWCRHGAAPTPSSSGSAVRRPGGCAVAVCSRRGSTGPSRPLAAPVPTSSGTPSAVTWPWAGFPTSPALRPSASWPGRSALASTLQGRAVARLGLGPIAVALKAPHLNYAPISLHLPRP